MNKKEINILLVDDDRGDRKLVEMSLKKGVQDIICNIYPAETLAHGIELLNSENLDLILLDLGLPDSNGIENVNKIKQENENIPIIVLTGLSDEEVGVNAIKRGAIDYITKPFKPTGLRTRIGIALQIVKLQNQLTQLANTDELTNLANRRNFFNILEREILHAKMNDQKIALMMIDIDHFKLANDTYGHRGGDEILRQMGKILTENIYPLDVAARYGGEEFIILMPNTTSVKAAQAASRLRKIIDQHRWKIADTEISITVSIGFVNIDNYNQVSAYDFVEKADAALYTAKNRGRNCVVSYDEISPDQKTEVSEDKTYFELQQKVDSLAESLQNQTLGTISAFSRAMDMVIKDPYLLTHSQNVSTYATEIAKYMGLSDELANRIGVAALVQDLGIIGIPSTILTKKETLSESEHDIIKQHPQAAAQILEPIGIFNLELNIIKHHHERFDGDGYPNGLKGKEIPIGSRILTVADAFDAITAERCHCDSRTVEEAIEEISINSKTQFDPEVVKALKAVYQNHIDEWPLATGKCMVANMK